MTFAEALELNRSILNPNVRRVSRPAREHLRLSTIQHLQPLRAQVRQQILRVDESRLLPLARSVRSVFVVLRRRPLARRLRPDLRLVPFRFPRLHPPPEHHHPSSMSVLHERERARLRRARRAVSRVYRHVSRLRRSESADRSRERLPRRERLRQRRRQVAHLVVIIKRRVRDALALVRRARALDVVRARPARVDDDDVTRRRQFSQR